MFRSFSRRRRVLCEALEDRTFFSITWKTVAAMPVPRSEGAAFVADGKFFCLGGFDNATTLTIPNEMDACDPTTNTWTRMADCPIKVNDAPVTVDPVTDTAWLGGVFLNDGFHASGLMYEYHIQTNTWSQGPSLPLNIGAGQMGIVGRMLYYFGGRDSNNIGTTATWRLNLDNPSAGWTADTPMLYTANHDGAVNLNNKIYALGGIVNKEETTSNENYVQIFDPSTDKWTLGASIPVGLGHIASAATVADGDIIIAGGQVDGAGQVMTKSVYQYNPNTNSWSSLTNLPDYRTSDFVGFLDGDLIVTGGNMYSSPYISTTTWVAAYSNSNTPPPLPAVSIGNATAQAGSDLLFTAQLSSAASSNVTADYSFIAGSAPLTDFNSVAGTVSFAAGSTTATIDVPTSSDSTGANETFTITLSSLSSNAAFANAQATESATGTITPVVVQQQATTTTMNASTASIAAGDLVTFTALVTEASGIPAGTVTFFDDSTSLGSVALDSTGSAQLAVSDLPVGSDIITARFSGSATLLPSTSSPIGETVATASTALASSTALSASSATLVVGQSDTFTATVSSAAAGAVPTGSVTLFDDGESVGTYPLDENGVASISVQATAGKSVTLYTAVYNGDATYASSTSNAVPQTYLAAAPLTASFGKVKIPSTGIPGQPFAATISVPLTNDGAAQRGHFTLTVFADTSATGLSAAPVALGTVVRGMGLRSGASSSIGLHLKKLPATLPPGTYHIIAQLTDTLGQFQIITSANTVTVAAPVITLAAALTSSPVPTDAKFQVLTLALTNTGNIAARGLIACVITTATGDNTALILHKQHWPAYLKPGGQRVYRIRVKIPAAAATSTLYPTATVQLGAISTSVSDSTPL